MRKFTATLLGAAASLAVAGPIQAAEPAWITESNRNAQMVLEVQAKFFPEGAARIGVEGYDDRIIDLKDGVYERRKAAADGVLAELDKRRKAATDAKVRQDLDILVDSVQNDEHSAELERKYMLPYYDATGLVYGSVRGLLDPRIPKERQRAVIARLRKYSGMEHGYQPITELMEARTLERLKANPKLIGPFKGEIEQDLANSKTLMDGMEDLLKKSGLNDWEKPLATLENQLIAYNKWLTSDVLPRARSDAKLPPEIYADNLKQFGVDLPLDELVSRALTAYGEWRNEAQVIASQIAKEKGWKDDDYRSVIKRLKQEQIPDDQILSTYQTRLAKIEQIIREHDIVTLPDRAAKIRLATPAETAQQPAPHMSPPRLVGNKGEYGEFVLPSGLPPDPTGKALRYDDFSHQAGTWSLIAHEARPGHEMQFAKMVESGVSTARAVFAFNSVNVEGWALYAEAIMKPYFPLDGQLFGLQFRMQRAARAFLDPMVNLGQVTPAQVKSFLMDEVGLSEAMAQQEVDRYTYRAPGQATSYFDGYERLMEIRERAEVKLRDRFDQRAFHDFVLSQGLIPPKLLEKAVMEEFVPAQLAKPAKPAMPAKPAASAKPGT